jgi:hypothetical protein
MEWSVSISRMTNDECRMMKEIRMTNAENVGEHVFVLRASSFFRHSSFELRHYSQAPRMRDTSGRLKSLLKISSRGASLI